LILDRLAILDYHALQRREAMQESARNPVVLPDFVPCPYAVPQGFKDFAEFVELIT
jgi:hypothetical protein